MGETSIEWTDVTWNPVRGCSVVSPGCTNCYAMKFAHRFNTPGREPCVGGSLDEGKAPGPYFGLTKLTKGGPVWTGKIRLVPEVLDAPLRWRKPQRIFVNSMSDLFHEDVPDEYVDRCFKVMALARRHTFQILTKRPQRMRRYMESADERKILATLGEIQRNGGTASRAIFANLDRLRGESVSVWPLPNVWLGVSAEDHERADERIPELLQTPAAVRFVSYEPALGPIDFKRWLRGGGWRDVMFECAIATCIVLWLIAHYVAR
jgi:protein gp37